MSVEVMRAVFSEVGRNDAQASAVKAALRAARERAESDLLQSWAAGRAADGAHPSDLTWETCVRESGLWKEPDAEAPGEGDERLGGVS